MFVKCFLLSWLLVQHLCVFATDDPNISYLTTQNGLSNNSVISIFQDRYGFMWLGTVDGLNKYDGYSFITFRNKTNDTTSLPSSRITCINEDNTNEIWIGTLKGICVYNPVTGQFKTAYYRQNNVLHKLSRAIRDIKKISNGSMLVATAGKGLVVFAKNNLPGKIIPLQGRKHQCDYEVKSVAIDKKGQVWAFVTGHGICLYDTARGILKALNGNIPEAHCIETGADNTIWVGNDKGLHEYDIYKNRYVKVHDRSSGSLNCNRVLSICHSGKEVWVATDGGGVNVLDHSGFRIKILRFDDQRNDLLSTAAFTIFEDKDNRKWIGTLRGGISIADPHKNQISSISANPAKQNSLVNNFVLSLCEEASGKLWIGTDGGGVSLWDRSKNSFENFNYDGSPGSLRNNYVTNILCDRNNTIWMATYGGGINRFNRRDNTFKHYSCIFPATGKPQNNAWVLYEDKDKRLWAGVFEGALYYYDPASDKFVLFHESLNDILAIAEDKSGNLWAGNRHTLYKINKSTGSFTGYHIGTTVRCIYEDKAGNFWIGTEGNGLLLFNRDKGNYTSWSQANGLSNNSLMKILEDHKGNLWISTFKGLNKFDPLRKTFTTYYEGDGLQSSEFSYNAGLITLRGEFVFGSLKGIALFYPDKLRNDYKTPELRLTSLELDNIPVEQLPDINQSKGLNDLRQITVPYNKSIMVAFAALEYTAPDKIRYAYYLEGLDKNWRDAELSRTANYTHLNEGRYTLHIKSTNASGLWKNNERMLTIIVMPPWYRTWWAYVLYGSIAAGLIYLYIAYKTRQARLQYEVRLAHMEAEKEKELSERKINFFTNVSHELRAPLSLIVNPLKEILHNSNGYFDAGDINIVYRNAQRLLGLADQLLLFQKSDEPDQLRVSLINFAEVCREVYLCFVQQASNKKINYQFMCASPEIELYADREKIEIALFNIISNALKYTPENGNVVFAIHEMDEVVMVSIKDSGPGIPKNVGNRLFDKFYQVHENNTVTKGGFGIGLYIAKNYVESQKGSIHYNSTKEQGTEFVLEFKKGKLHFDDPVVFTKAIHEDKLFDELAAGTENTHALKAPDPPPSKEKVADEMLNEAKTMLIVDDDAEMCKYLAHIFSSNFKLLEAGHGPAAIELVKKHMPDIIICDVMMGEMSGIEFCSHIKQDASLSHVPVILLTGSSSADLKLKGVECGADDYISKPFDNELLIARVNTVLKSRTNLQKYFYNEITLQKQTLKISEEHKNFLERCIAIVEKYIDDENFTIKVLAKEMGMSHSGIYKKVKSISGQSVNGFIRFIRLRKAAELLINSHSNVNEIAFQTGFTDLGYFRNHFNKLFGMNPSEYIKKYRKPFQKNFTVNEKLIKGNDNN